MHRQPQQTPHAQPNPSQTHGTRILLLCLISLLLLLPQIIHATPLASTSTPQPPPPILTQCEMWISDGSYQQAIDTLSCISPESLAPWESYQARLLVKAYLMLGSSQEGDWNDPARKTRMRTLYDQALVHAEQATEYDPADARAWFARASALGSISTLVPPLQALGKLNEVKQYLDRSINLDPTLSEPYNLLALFYSVLPGWPISFGNKEFGVNLSRYAIKLAQDQGDAEAEYTYMITLEAALIARGWDADKRVRAQKRYAAQYSNAKSDFTRATVIEGVLEIPYLSDTEEARLIREQYDLPVAGASQKSPVD